MLPSLNKPKVDVLERMLVHYKNSIFKICVLPFTLLFINILNYSTLIIFVTFSFKRELEKLKKYNKILVITLILINKSIKYFYVIVYHS